VKRILFIIDGLAGGGAERVVLTLSGSLAERGNEVTLLSLRSEQVYLPPPSVRFLTLFDDYHGPMRRWNEIGRRARALNDFLAEIDGGRQWDIAFSVLPKTDRIVATTPLLRDAWLCLHGAVASTQLGARSEFHAWIKRRQLRSTYDRRRWLAVSDGLAKDMGTRTLAEPTALAVIPNPFDVENIRRQAEAPCPLAGEHFLVHVGRFHPIKRHDRLFAAFRISGYTGRLVLIGDGTPSQRDALQHIAVREGVADRIVWAGFLTNPFPWLRTADALVLSSDSEGFGNVLVESLACGTPAISTDCPFGPRDILTGNLAHCLSPLTPDGLAETINAVLRARPVITDDALVRFRVENVVDRYLALADYGDRQT
jgi:glycosyltransferase involved in cell wall biosynthesis